MMSIQAWYLVYIPVQSNDYKTHVQIVHQTCRMQKAGWKRREQPSLHRWLQQFQGVWWCWLAKGFLHPWRLTWNIIMEVWKIIFLSKWVICSFHVNLPRCSWWKQFTALYPTIYRVCSCFFIPGCALAWNHPASLAENLINLCVFLGFQTNHSVSTCSTLNKNMELLLVHNTVRNMFPVVSFFIVFPELISFFPPIAPGFMGKSWHGNLMEL